MNTFLGQYSDIYTIHPTTWPNDTKKARIPANIFLMHWYRLPMQSVDVIAGLHSIVRTMKLIYRNPVVHTDIYIA